MLFFLKAGLYLKGQFFSNIWNMPISIFWMLLIINAFNLVDVMDGLATTLAIGAIGSFLMVAVFFDNHPVIILLCSLLGGLCAFLWYNKPVAKIYLGDAGSLFIGGLLSIIPFLFNWGAYTPCGYLTPLIVLAIPLLEVSTLIVIRTCKRIPFYRGSPDHFSIYLQQNGWSKGFILGYVALLSLILGMVAFFFLINAISLITVCGAAGCFLLSWVCCLLQKPLK